LDDSVSAAKHLDQTKQRCRFEATPGALRGTGRSAELDE
jgi:hypothetical protein